MKAALAHRLNSALAGIDTAKINLSIACGSGGDEAIEACGDAYLKARDEMGATMKAITKDAAPTSPIKPVSEGEELPASPPA